MGNRTFQSRTGFAFWMLMIVSTICMFAAFAIESYLLTFLLAMFVLLQIESLVHTEYVIAADGWLYIRSGRFLPTYKVQLSSIVKIDEVRSIMLAPALSMKRVRIYYKNEKHQLKIVMISPKNQEVFLRSLETREKE